MKYHILINQAGIVNAGLHTQTDVVDWSLLDYIFSWQQSPSAARIDGKVWINYKHLIAEMPLLGLNEKSGVSKRIKKIRELGLIETFQSPDDCRLYAHTTDLYFDITQFKGVPKEPATVHQNQRGVDDGQRGVDDGQRGVDDGQHSYNHQEPTINNQKEVVVVTREEVFIDVDNHSQAGAKDLKVKEFLNFDDLTADEKECWHWAMTVTFWSSTTSSVKKFLQIYRRTNEGGLRDQFNAHKKALQDGSGQTGQSHTLNKTNRTGNNYATNHTNNKPLTATQRRANLERIIGETGTTGTIDESNVVASYAFVVNAPLASHG